MTSLNLIKNMPLIFSSNLIDVLFFVFNLI
ncbi:hypothetical protein CoNPh26_CDS0094 [Staphylococcus phage S-CoN_Ph26]|nr:hypothetical protein CoNPh26_CDS0094 [Staphylococcus phage S-CoN_Ph26]